MGNTVSRFCQTCFTSEEQDHYIPLVDTTEPPKKQFPTAAPIHSEEQKFEENHPKQDYLFKLIENACIEFISHIRCEFEEDGFTEALSKSNTRVFSKDSDNSFTLKSEYFLECSPDDVIELLVDTKTRKNWDETVEKIENVVNLPEETSVSYVKYKENMIAASRDVLLVNRVMKAQNGLMLVSTSCELEDYPVLHNTSRVCIEVTGYYIEPFNDFKSRMVSYTTEAAGELQTSSVKSAIINSLPKFVSGLQKAAKNRKKA